MRQCILFLTIVLSLSVVKSNIGADLSNRVRQISPPHQPTLGSFVQGIQTQVWSEQADIQVGQIDSFINADRNQNVGGRNFNFRPFSDLSHLRFGNTYHMIHHENSINSPGFCFTKATAVIGSKNQNNIAYKVGYGVTTGNGIQLRQVVKVEICNKKFFTKRCWFEEYSAPKSLLPHEFTIVLQGLENNLYNAIADRVASRRLLSQDVASPSSSQRLEGTFQLIQGVEPAQLVAAVNSLVGEEVQIDSEALLQGKQIRVDTASGLVHSISAVSQADSSILLSVSTNKIE